MKEESEEEAFTGRVAITTTKRRRFFWCAFWTGAPTRDPFRKPDAWGGGARTEAEARAQAERAAGRPLADLAPIWARAWVRVLAGSPPWTKTKARAPKPEEPPREAPRRRGPSFEAQHGACPFAVLGLAKSATAPEIKRAFRRLSLQTHPDLGGTAAAFIRVKHALDEALLRSGSHG